MASKITRATYELRFFYFTFISYLFNFTPLLVTLPLHLPPLHFLFLCPFQMPIFPFTFSSSLKFFICYILSSTSKNFSIIRLQCRMTLKGIQQWLHENSYMVDLIPLNIRICLKFPNSPSKWSKNSPKGQILVLVIVLNVSTRPNWCALDASIVPNCVVLNASIWPNRVV